MTALIDVVNLRVSFVTRAEPLRVVRGVDLRLARGEALGIVGETGSGKTVATSAFTGLLPPAARVEADALAFDGRSLLRDGVLDTRAVEALRGRGIGMIFQDPSSAMNPVFTIGEVMVDVLRRHEGLRFDVARTRALELLGRVGLPDPGAVFGGYPHRLSGGMKQRAAIATVLATRPSLLIADEPTTALDATVQAQVLALLAELRRDSGESLIFISHDLAVVSRVCDRVAVMYAGRIVEEGAVEQLYRAPAHPYTRGLFAARPMLRRPSRLDEVQAVVRTRERLPLMAIPGAVPPLSQLPQGCAFHPRCLLATARCAAEVPPLAPLHPAGEKATEVGDDAPGGDIVTRVACFHPMRPDGES